VGYIYIKEIELERLDVFMQIISYGLQSLKLDALDLV